MKRPNGTGTVIKRSGNRRCPYDARITIGQTPDGKQIIKTVGHYTSRDEALAALFEYNKSPYDIDMKQITMTEIYERWLTQAKSQGRLATNTLASMVSGYAHCADLYNMPYSSIKAHMMQTCVDNCGHGYATQRHIKQLFQYLDRYAYEYDIINKKYSDLISTDSGNPKQKKPFKDSEVITLWDNIDMPWVDTILLLLYSGWRISELLGLTKINVVIDPSGKTVNYMTGGVKTKAGKDRIVPIHSAILPLVKKRYKACDTYLIENNRKFVTYDVYIYYFKKIMDALCMKHTIHETRHTFRTWFNRTPANIAFINKIMGHKCHDIGLEVYTNKNIEELRDTIELIKSINTR